LLRFLRLPLGVLLMGVERVLARVTHLSTAATIGDTVIAAVRAVAASMRSLAGIFRFSMSGTVAIRSTELTLIIRFKA
jgi:hypothetical protein